MAILDLSSSDILASAYPGSPVATMAGLLQHLSGLPVTGVGGVTRAAPDGKGGVLIADPSEAIDLIERGEVDFLG